MFFWCELIDLTFLHTRSGFLLLLKFVLVSNFSIFVSGRSTESIFVVKFNRISA
jgi:hypothetical protein